MKLVSAWKRNCSSLICFFCFKPSSSPPQLNFLEHHFLLKTRQNPNISLLAFTVFLNKFSLLMLTLDLQSCEKAVGTSKRIRLQERKSAGEKMTERRKTLRSLHHWNNVIWGWKEHVTDKMCVRFLWTEEWEVVCLLM